MTDNNQYLHWLTLEESKTVKFSDLAHLMAQAMQPDADDVELALCEIDITAELKQAVTSGALVVRNPNTLGSHTFPHGAALQSAVLIPNIDLPSFLEARGIGLRLTPEGNGPRYWAPQNAASALQIQESWHDGTRAEFQDQMQEAAQRGALIVLNPRTCLPYAPETVRSNYEYVVTPANVNAWLTTLDAPYRWEVEAPPAPVVAVQGNVLETVEQRRDRYLEWLTAEEKISKREALQRVFEREQKQNPKADRANIGKDIKKARVVQTDRKRAGHWETQLVQDGKRPK